MLVITLRSLRHRLRAYIGALHGFLVLGILGGLSWHLVALPKPSTLAKVSVILAMLLWLLSFPVFAARLLWRGARGTVTQVSPLGTAGFTIQTQTRRPVRIAPGKYFDLYRWREPFHAYQCIALAADVDHLSIEKGARDVRLVVMDTPSGHRFNSWLGETVLIDGPRGLDLHLEGFENIFATAKGMGIASILSAAIFLAGRKHHDKCLRDRLMSLDESLFSEKETGGELDTDTGRRLVYLEEKRMELSQEPVFRDAGRRFSIFWGPEDSSQVQHFASQIRLLQQLDPDQVCCYQKFKEIC